MVNVSLIFLSFAKEDKEATFASLILENSVTHNYALPIDPASAFGTRTGGAGKGPDDGHEGGGFLDFGSEICMRLKPVLDRLLGPHGKGNSQNDIPELTSFREPNLGSRQFVTPP